MRNLPAYRISHIFWSRIIVVGFGEGKDLKLFPGDVRERNWNETGTRHMPWIRPADVKEFFGHGVSDVILSLGMELQLQTCPETLDLLEEKAITAHWLETKEAVEFYNQLLQEGRPVGALLHSRC